MSQLLRNNDKQFLIDLKRARKVFILAIVSNRTFRVTKSAVYYEAATTKIKYHMFNDKNGNPNMLIE